MRKKFLKNSSAAIALSIGMAHPSLAIDLDLEEVVVTAQFRSQSIQDVPLAITAISGAQLENAGISDYRDLVNLAPGIQMTSFSLGNPGLTIRGIQSTILDLASEPAVALYVDGVYIKRSVEQLVDLERVEILRGPQGTLYGRNTTAGVLSFITKKPGPDLDAKLVFEAARFNSFAARGYVSGALADNLFGKISFSGRRSDHPAKNLVEEYPFSKRKSDLVRGTLVFEASENAEFTLIADYQKDRTPGAIGTPVKTETVEFGGFGPNGPIVNQVVLFDPTSTDPDLNPTGRVATSNLDSMQDELEKDNRDEYGISLTGNIDLSFGTLTTISAFRDYKHEVTTDVDGTPCVLSAPFFIGEVFRDLAGFGLASDVKCFLKGDPELVARGLLGSQWAGNNSTNSEQITQEIRIASKDGSPLTFDGKLDWVFGMFYYNEKGVSERSTDINGLVNAHSFHSTIDVGAWAGFGQLVYHATDRFNISLGARYTTETKDYVVSGVARPLIAPLFATPDPTDLRIVAGWDTQPSFDFANIPNTFQQPPGGGFPNIPLGTDAVCELMTRCIPETAVSDTFNSFDPKLTLDYKISDDAMVFASVGTGYKSGGFNGTPVSLSVGIDAYDEEKVVAYEAGFKAGFLDNKVRVNFNAFYYDYEGEQIFGNFDHDKNAATPTALLTRNAAESTKQGFEIETFFVPSERLKVRITYAYLDATYGDFPIFNGPIEIDNFAGNTAIQAPKHSGSISVDWLLPVPENMGDLMLRVDGNFNSKQFFIVENLEDNVQEGYDIWNLNLIWQPTEELRVSLWGKNIFDKEYVNFKFQAGAPNLVLPFGVFDVGRERSRSGAPRTFGVTVSYQFGG